MKIFEVNFNQLLVDYTPNILRTKELFSFVRAMLQQLIEIYDSFVQNRNDNLYAITITPQVCYLRKMLNDKFRDASVTQKDILITDGQTTDWIILYEKDLFTIAGGKQALMLKKASSVQTDEYGRKTYKFINGATMVAKQGSFGNMGYDFTVKIPIELQSKIDEARVISLLNYYKLASKRYIINYYKDE